MSHSCPAQAASWWELTGAAGPELRFSPNRCSPYSEAWVADVSQSASSPQCSATRSHISHKEIAAELTL